VMVALIFGGPVWIFLKKQKKNKEEKKASENVSISTSQNWNLLFLSVS